MFLISFQAEQLGRHPNKFEVHRVLHWDKKNGKWKGKRSETLAVSSKQLNILDNLHYLCSNKYYFDS